jgi:hypothetical protein
MLDFQAITETLVCNGSSFVGVAANMIYLSKTKEKQACKGKYCRL